MSRATAAVRLVLRLERAGLVACAVLAFGVTMAAAASFSSMAGTTPAERLAFAQQAEQLARPASILLPTPERVDTLAGFVQWRVFGGLPFFLVAWTLFAGTSATRGDEERGRLDAWLATGVSRPRWVAARCIGFALAAAGVAALAGVATLVGTALGAGTLPLGRLAAVCVALWALVMACYAVVLIAAQFAATRRSAVALGGALLGGLHLLNAIPRGQGAVPFYRWLSPFYLYERSNALVPGGRFDAPATMGLFAGAILLVVLASTAFTRRDLGAPLFRVRSGQRPRAFVPSENPVWRIAPFAALFGQRFVLLGWIAAAALMTQALTAMARPIVDTLLSSPATRSSARLLGVGDPYQALIGYFLFGTLQLLTAFYAIVQVGTWASDDASGRLEMRLSAPVSRRRVILERGLALTLALAIIAGVGTISGLLGARNHGISIEVSAGIAAAGLLLPFGLSFGGIGALLVGARPRIAVPLLGAFAVVSFFLLEFGILFGWPAWVVRLSVFDLYGAPLVEGATWSGLSALISLSLISFGLAVFTMQRRDIDR